MQLGEPDASGRRRPVEKENSEFVVDVDCVVMSIGTSPNPLIKSTTEGLDTQKWGGIIADDTGLTSREGVYAGGDAVTGAATVILAMGAGKAAAKGIDEYLSKINNKTAFIWLCPGKGELEEQSRKKMLKFAACGAMVAALAMTAGCGGGEKKADQKVLKVGMECAYAPYNWSQTSAEGGAVQIAGSKEFAYGYDVMIAKKLADSMGAKLEVHKIEWDGLPPAVVSGKIDAVIMSGSSEVGVESTVVSLATNPPRLLRPGGIDPDFVFAEL